MSVDAWVKEIGTYIARTPKSVTADFTFSLSKDKCHSVGTIQKANARSVIMFKAMPVIKSGACPHCSERVVHSGIPHSKEMENKEKMA